MTNTVTRSDSFTIVHARYICSKVAADMHQCALFYGNPAEQWIRNYAEELAHYLNAGYVEEYEFGYKMNDKRVVSWRYKAGADGILRTDDRAGQIVSWIDITGASFFNYLTQNSKFFDLSSTEQAKFKANLPVKRVDGYPPKDGNGYWKSDNSYSAAGRGFSRETFQPY